MYQYSIVGQQQTRILSPF